MEVEKQLKGRKVYQKVRFSENILTNLVEKSNTIFKNLRRKDVISEKELKYFSFEYKKTTNFGKLYLLPEIHKCLKNVLGRPAISNCGTPTEKVSEFLDHHFKPVMQSGWSYIRDSGGFLKKIKNVSNISANAISVRSDVVGLYPKIPDNAGLKSLSNMLEARKHKAVSTEDVVKMTRFFFRKQPFRI